MGDWIGTLIRDGGYLAVAGLMLLETIFPPVPSEIIMSFAGVQAGKGELSLPGAIAAGVIGAMIGNLAWYLVARRLGVDRFKRLVRRHGRWLTLQEKEVDRADRFFDRWNRWFVCLGRLVPTVRSLVSIPAGLFEMPLASFLVWSTLGTTGWTAALAYAGHALGERYGDIDRWLGPISNGILVALLVVYVWRVIRWRKA
ncbi:DedA family protein [Sphingomonas jatrophae]|uniref:Membrane protein DedA, SNARE-associated domain n=1 Tax=Sphingomonas jatrophae TaxID=1166337 RepID=A0A1I6JHK9_9SPHN|nr:DedA family protein [Sphingomonas jatrophae]SFR78354.1 membrane protein DedA, SNARE-associated domain [Sphingomonas jatrophae]